jgi:very-short-patch-repair endonuclease
LRNQSTDAERYLWQHLRGKQLAGYRFRRQLPIAGFIADFACLEAKLMVELDGGQHAQHVGYDEQRDRLIEAQGFRILRFWDNQVFLETQAVLEQIMRALELSSPHPDPPPQAEEGMESVDLPPQAREGT